jgi:hypothetical protein
MIGKFLFRVTAGLGVAMLFSGGKVLELILVAVVCTAGAGLLVVVPAAYLIGLVCTIWFIPFGSGEWSYKQRRAEKDLALGEPFSRARSTAAIVRYLRSSELKGERPEEADANLLHAGWSAEEIRIARRAMEGGQFVY